MVRIVFVLVGVLWTASLLGQVGPGISPDPCATSDRATFDVVSVRPSDPAARGSRIMMGPGSFSTSGTRLIALITNTYDLRDFQVLEGPDWVRTDRFDVIAKYDAPEADPSKLDDAGRKTWRERRTQSLQSLLEDRFKLKCHMSSREMPVYELVVAKGGPKFQETKADNTDNSFGVRGGPQRTRQLAGKNATMEGLAQLLSSEVSRVVVDKTGLPGKYDVTANWTQDAPSAAQNTEEPAAPTIFTALEEQLGLKLQPAKGPVRVLVIDSVERPAEN